MSEAVRLIRHVGTAALAGAIAGFFVAGVLGRIAMRIAGFMSRPELIGVQTANGNRVGEITLSGTLALAIFVGVASGLAGGVLYASAEPWLRSRSRRGLIFGAALLAALGFTAIEPFNFDFERFGVTALNVALFALLFLAFGVAIAYLFDRISRGLRSSGPLAAALGIAVWLGALGAVALGALLSFSVGGIADLALPALFAVAALVPPLVLWRGLPRYVGYAAFGAPVAVGGFRTIAGILELVF